MSIIKSDLPILEYDTDNKAVIMPEQCYDFIFSERAVMLFMDNEIEHYVKVNNCEVIGRFVSVTKPYPVYKTIYDGTEITICQAPLGGAASVQIMEQLIAGGVKKIIAAGCCGALYSDNEGDFYIPTSAIRDEGTSYHYLPPSREIELNQVAINAIEKTLSEKKFTYKKCKTWTTDGFYRETKEMVQYRKSEGCSVVEMECAALTACAKFRDIVFGQILFTADSLANTDVHNTRNWGDKYFEIAMNLAIEAVAEV